MQQCTVCRSTKSHLYFRYGNHTVYRCENCGVEFIYPFPTGEEIAQIYSEGYFSRHNEGVNGYADYEGMKLDLQIEAIKRLGVIQKYILQGNLLDIGCGAGVFLSEAKKLGYQVAGNDISPYAIRQLQAEKIQCYPGELEKALLPDSFFDCVTAWDVIEHIPDSNKIFNVINKSLKVGGYIFLTTPDTDMIDRKILGTHWYSYHKIPEHVLFFNKKSVEALCQRNGFRLKKVIPWGFVRDLRFVFSSARYPFFKEISAMINRFSFADKKIFMPLTDSFMVIEKVEDIS